MKLFKRYVVTLLLSLSFLFSIIAHAYADTSLDSVVRFEKTYDGGGVTDVMDVAFCLIQVQDYGYIVLGNTQTEAHSDDLWLIRTDVNGNIVWNRTYGGNGFDKASSIIQTSDYGYAIAGYTDSGAGDDDFWLLKTDSNGTLQWNQTYGREYDDEQAYAITQTVDDGYMLFGRTRPYGTYVWDYCLIKTNATGHTVWNKTYGGIYTDAGNSLVQTIDGGYALGGGTESFGAGNYDFWLVKTDAYGDIQWNKTFGSAQLESLGKLISTSDGGFALVGYTNSGVSGGLSDIWLVKTDGNGNLQWSKKYGKPDHHEEAHSILQTSGGDYVLIGKNWSDTHYGTMIKVDANGNVIWTRTLGSGSWDADMLSIIETNDGGYAAAGYSWGRGYDFWLVKTDSQGIVPEFSPLVFWALLILLTLTVVYLTKANGLSRKHNPCTCA